MKWGRTEVTICKETQNVRVICHGDLCHDCKELRDMTGWADNGDEWLEKIEHEPGFADSMDVAAAAMSTIDADARDRATRKQWVKTGQQLRMRVQAGYDLYTLDQYAVKFKHRAQTNRRVCICKLANQEGDPEVLAVVPRDEPRRLIIETDISLGMQQEIMPFVVMPNQCHNFFAQERRRQVALHPQSAQQQHFKFYHNASALLEETRQREAAAAKAEEDKALEGAVRLFSDHKKQQLKALTADGPAGGVRAPGTPAMISAPGTPGGLRRPMPAPSTPSGVRSSQRSAPSTPGLLSSNTSNVPAALSPASKTDESRLALVSESPRAGSRKGLWPASSLGAVSSRASSAISSRSTNIGTGARGAASRASSRTSDGGCPFIETEEEISRLWDFKAMMLGVFVWTNHNGVTC